MIVECIEQNNMMMFYIYLSKVTEIDTVYGRSAVTVLFYAISHRNTEAVIALLGHGANPNFSNITSHTPLMWAAMRGDLETMRVLIEHGADVNTMTDLGDTAFHYAATEIDADSIKFLLNNGVDLTLRDSGGRTPKELIELVGNKELIALFDQVTV